MTVYDDIRAEAIPLIKEMGRPCYMLTNTDAAPVDTTKPWRVGTGTVSAVAGSFVVVDDKMPEKGEANKICIIPGDFSVVPDETKRIQLGENAQEVYAISAITIYAPDGIPIGWKMRLTLWPTS